MRFGYNGPEGMKSDSSRLITSYKFGYHEVVKTDDGDSSRLTDSVNIHEYIHE